MQLVDYLVIGVIALIIGGAVAYIIKQKRRGAKCIGCPYAKSCSSRGCCSSGPSCSCPSHKTASRQESADKDKNE